MLCEKVASVEPNMGTELGDETPRAGLTMRQTRQRACGPRRSKMREKGPLKVKNEVNSWLELLLISCYPRINMSCPLFCHERVKNRCSVILQGKG